MDKYGIDNVRGGSFVSMKLDDSTITHLNKMSNGTNNRCFARDCFQQSDQESDQESEEVWCCNYCYKEFSTKKGALFHQNVYCKKNYRNQK